MDMGVLSIMGLGEGRGVTLGLCFLRSASFSCSHCSAILPQSTAVCEVALHQRKQENQVHFYETRESNFIQASLIFYLFFALLESVTYLACGVLCREEDEEGVEEDGRCPWEE